MPHFFSMCDSIFPSFGLCFYIKNVWNLQARGMRSTQVFHSEVP